MKNPISIKISLKEIKRAMACLLAVALLINDTFAYAASDYRNCAPPTQLPLPVFQERFEKGYDALAHQALNNYIARYIASRVLNIKPEEVTDDDIKGIGKVDITKYLETRRDKVPVQTKGGEILPPTAQIEDSYKYGFEDLKTAYVPEITIWEDATETFLAGLLQQTRWGGGEWERGGQARCRHGPGRDALPRVHLWKTRRHQIPGPLRPHRALRWQDIAMWSVCQGLSILL